MVRSGPTIQLLQVAAQCGVLENTAIRPAKRWNISPALRRRATMMAVWALALFQAPMIGAQQLYSGSFEQHVFDVETAGCSSLTTLPETTSSQATYSLPFEVDAPTCSFASAGGSTTIKGLMNMKFPPVTPTAVVTPGALGGYFTVQFQTPLLVEADTSGFFLLSQVVSSQWLGYSLINGEANDPCPTAESSMAVPQGQSLFSATRSCSVTGTAFGYVRQDASGNDVLRIKIYTSMQTDLQYVTSGPDADTHVAITITSTYVLTPIATNPIPQITAGGVVNAASLTPKVAPGSIVSIFGSNLAASTVTTPGAPLTTTLGGTSVTIGGYSAPLIYVSTTQINCQVPFEVPTGAPAAVVVTNAGQISNSVSVTVADYAIGVFTYARTSSVFDPIVTHMNSQLVSPASPALPNEPLVVYATGIGKLTDQPSTGAAAPSDPLATALDQPTVTVGGTPAKVLFAGLAPAFVGLVQLNIQLPESLAGGNLPIVIESQGDSSPPVSLAVGTGPPQPKLSESTTALAFGNVAIAHTKDLAMTVSNGGNALLVVNSVASSSGLFTVTSAPTFSVQPFSSATLTVRFSPASPGPQSGTLTLASNDPVNSSVAISLSGSGVAGASTTTLAVDGGTFNTAIGFPTDAHATFVNRLTPPSYPATLVAVEIYFGQRSGGLAVNAPFTLLVETNPSGSASISPSTAGVVNLYSTTVGGLGGFNTYTLPTPITITSGDFVVGFQVNDAADVYPADEDQVTKSQGRSYASSDGVAFSVIDTFAGFAGNLGIRAVVALPAGGG